MSPRPSPPIWAAMGTCCSNLNALVHNLDGVGAEEVAHFLGHLNLRGAQALASAGYQRVPRECILHVRGHTNKGVQNLSIEMHSNTRTVARKMRAQAPEM